MTFVNPRQLGFCKEPCPDCNKICSKHWLHNGKHLHPYKGYVLFQRFHIWEIEPSAFKVTIE